MNTQNTWEEIYGIIRREERIRELVGEEMFQELSSHEQEKLQLIDQLAEILFQIYLEQEQKGE